MGVRERVDPRISADSRFTIFCWGYGFGGDFWELKVVKGNRERNVLDVVRCG